MRLQGLLKVFWGISGSMMRGSDELGGQRNTPLESKGPPRETSVGCNASVSDDVDALVRLCYDTPAAVSCDDLTCCESIIAWQSMTGLGYSHGVIV